MTFKKIVAKIVVISFAILIVATPTLSVQEICSAAEGDTGKVMDARQYGVPKWLIMSYNKGNKVSEYMTHKAYLEPIYSTEKEKKISIMKFMNRMRKECYTAQQ